MNSSAQASNAAVFSAATAPANSGQVRFSRSSATETTAHSAPLQPVAAPSNGVVANVLAAQPGTAWVLSGRKAAHPYAGNADEGEHVSPTYEPNNTQNGWRRPLYTARDLTVESG
ncbi:uncharacterized protein PHACADRAFT_185668 [Phanerochaete carnosa HHB-10118-sp]|uniref:Uncharacterized protein n=1 Tax=Phanerochaete carnosa (strain HHB-10118-sp) TaxID=650164 RepID=K5UXL4_PHACS|nr:uncharacterized protein PHACADRAFT_185668 [Phanerochaete carnosa HHB-10118-sp]EKM54811.1 hypothetical protein PHACADRAFT_185668 [Phanerochaete carnosa HHB-10118-sp]